MAEPRPARRRPRRRRPDELAPHRRHGRKRRGKGGGAADLAAAVPAQARGGYGGRDFGWKGEGRIKPGEPGGFTDGSRWLSAAIPPEKESTIRSHPGGMPERKQSRKRELM